MSLPSAFSPEMPWLACGAGLGCSLPSLCPEGLLSIRIPQAHHVGLTQCSFSCSSTSLGGNLKITILSWLLLLVVLKLLVWKVSWVDLADRVPHALARQNLWVALGIFFFPFFKLSPSVYHTEAKRIVFFLLLQWNKDKQVSIAEPTSPILPVVRRKKDHSS